LLAAPALAACRAAAGPQTIRIGYQKNGVLLLARPRGGLEAALRPLGPVKVEWIEFLAGPPLLEATRAGAIDIGGVGDTPPIFAQSAGAPVVAVIVPAASPIRALRDLKAARVGLTKGSSSHLLLIQALRLVGLTMADVRPIYLAPPDAASAFASGSIDAWAIWDPYLIMAEHRAPTRTLVDRGALPPSCAYLIAYRPFAGRAPQLLAAVLDELAVQSAWGDAHADQAAAIISARTGIPDDIAILCMRRAPLALEPITPQIVARQQAAADIFRAQDFIPAPVAVKDAIWTGWRPVASPSAGAPT
jgi:sulfonate transport system substrate-binding protein